MGTLILIIVVLFAASAIVVFVLNKNKEKKYEQGFPDEVVKTKKLYKGSVVRYINQSECKTIIRYFVSGKTNTLADFIPNDEILVNDCLILFDTDRKKIAAIQDIKRHGVSKIIPFISVISLQPVEVSKTKKVTRGGISPISIKGYRWASSVTKMLKQVERIYVEVKYKMYDKEQTFDIVVFDGKSYEDNGIYAKKVEEVNVIINKFNEIIANS